MIRTHWLTRPPRWFLLIVTLTILLAIPSTARAEDPSFPLVAPSPALLSTPVSETLLQNAPSDIISLSNLTAILIVGPIDGDYGPATTAGKEVMNMAAAELTANGVTVHKFYTPANNWSQIVAATNGANFLFYRGHGVYWSSLPSPTVGGFYLKDDFISPNDIRNDLHLARGAIIVMSGACFASGSSSVPGDAIGESEAFRRVAQYSDPFFDIGAGGYYSNWYHSAPESFVRYLFAGMTLRQTYESFFDYNAGTVARYAHPDHPGLALWLDRDTYNGIVHYNYAFAGRPNDTLLSLFGAGEAPAEQVFLPVVTRRR